MKILVTGASGFVGARTCSHLEEIGHEVIRAGHKGSRDQAGLFLIDVSAPRSFREINAIDNIEVLVNCAGIAHRFGKVADGEFERVNKEGVKNLIEFAAARKIGRFVQLSSVMVYGRPLSNEPIEEDHPLEPEDDYSLSKLNGEIAAREACETAGIKLTILRPAPVIGEGSRGNVARLIRAIKSGRFAWAGEGKNTRSFVYVEDVARAVAAALDLEDRYAVFNVVGGELSVKDLVAIIAKRLQRKPLPVRIPESAARLALYLAKPFTFVGSIAQSRRALDSWLADAVYSGSAFRERGFHPATSVEEGLIREVDYYLKHK